MALATAFCAPLSAQSLDTHPVRLDGEGKLLSWVTPQDQAYARVAKLSADFIKNAMVGPINPANGLPVIYTHCEYDPDTFVGSDWPNHPAGRNSMLAESMRLYYQYSGDAAVLDAVTDLLDHQLAFGTTPATGYVWAKVPYSTAAAFTLFNVPFRALAYDLAPGYHEKNGSSARAPCSRWRARSSHPEPILFCNRAGSAPRARWCRFWPSPWAS